MDLNNKEKDFRQIYDANADKIFRFVFLRVSTREEALDITQEVFYKLWQTILNDQLISFPKTLLYKIAKNRVIDWYRKKKSESLDALLDNESDTKTFQVEDAKMERDLKLSSEASWVLGILNKLPLQYEEVIKMRFVEDLSLSEISQILNISENAVSLKLNHALKKLRQVLGINIEK